MSKKPTLPEAGSHDDDYPFDDGDIAALKESDDAYLNRMENDEAARENRHLAECARRLRGCFKFLEQELGHGMACDWLEEAAQHFRTHGRPKGSTDPERDKLKAELLAAYDRHGRDKYGSGKQTVLEVIGRLYPDGSVPHKEENRLKQALKEAKKSREEDENSILAAVKHMRTRRSTRRTPNR